MENKQGKAKAKIQEIVLEKSRENQNILLEFATGTGKTLAALKIIAEKIKTKKIKKAYIICKEHSHINGWKKEIELWGLEYLYDYLDLFLYHSIQKYLEKEKPDLICFDEVHALTPPRVEKINKITSENTFIISLSATVDLEKKKLLTEVCRGNLKSLKIPIKKAIKLGLLPQPKVYIHKIKLDSTRPYLEYKKNKGTKGLRKKMTCNFSKMFDVLKKNKHVELTVKCTEKDYYYLINKEIENYRNMFFSTKKEFFKQQMIFKGAARKRFLGSIKTSHAKNILKKYFEEFRFIAFCSSVDQAKELGGENVISSRSKKEKNVELINDFNDKKTDSIFSCHMGREGLNLKDLHKGLQIQLDGQDSALYFVQILGRVIRYENPELHIIITENTKDIDFLSKIKNKIENDWIIYR